MKFQELVYRPAILDDIDQLILLGLISYGHQRQEYSSEAWDKMKSGISDQQRWIDLINKSKSFVCVDKDKIVGMAFLMPSGNAWDIFPAEWSYIRMVGVEPAYQGKGIAKTLTKMCIEAAKQNHEKIIALHTSEMMHAARHVYESLGFKILKEIEPRFGKRYWLYTLQL
jgi:ribosomal protein S18 acetylase RimI-like enzyme